MTALHSKVVVRFRVVETVVLAVAKEILNAWFDTPYSDDEWNKRQIQQIDEIEKKYSGR
jgi:ribose 5-phosphate isomerase RpiB